MKFLAEALSSQSKKRLNCFQNIIILCGQGR